MENQRIQEYPSERKKVNGESRMVKGKKREKGTSTYVDRRGL